MKLSFESACMVVCLCVVTVLSAPAKKNTDSSSSSIQQQERELERLAKLAAQRLTHNFGVQKQKSYHYSNTNGKENSETETEEKVMNPATGEIVSDIRQDTKQDGGAPITETKIEIPSEHIEKTFMEGKPTEDDDSQSAAFQFTPIEVAKYLYQTGNFEELNEALKDLVNASIMTEKQAVEYKDNVRAAYNQLVQSTIYTDTNEVPLYNTGYEASEDVMPSEVLPGYNYYNELLPYGNADTQNIVPEVDNGNGISELVNTLMDEWLTRTVLTGDRDAETMLSEIWDNVSQDDNPDDLGQMRDILVDIFTSEIIEGLTSDTQQELPYYSDLLTNENADKPVKIESDKMAVDEKESNESQNTDDANAETENKEEEKTETKTEEDLKHLKM